MTKVKTGKTGRKLTEFCGDLLRDDGTPSRDDVRVVPGRARFAKLGISTKSGGQAERGNQFCKSLELAQNMPELTPKRVNSDIFW